jgi:hypothetical protein
LTTRHFLAGLEIGAVDEALGTVLIAAAGLPAIASPVFKAGAVLYVPRRNPDDSPRMVVRARGARASAVHQAAAEQGYRHDEGQQGRETIPRTLRLRGSLQGLEDDRRLRGSQVISRPAIYRPAGLCKMRKDTDEGKGDGEFCHVCKWLLVNRVDPGLHAILDDKYFPEAKGKEVEPPNV